MFYDGAESGNTSLWLQDGARNKCTSITTAADGGAPKVGSRQLSCNASGRVIWSDPAAVELMFIDLPAWSEILIRGWLRHDSDEYLASPDGSPRKLWRFDSDNLQVTDVWLFHALPSSVGSTGLAGGAQMSTYWGGENGFTTSWAKVEVYMSGTVFKEWINDVLVANNTINFGGTKPIRYYLMSNWSDCANHAGTSNPCGANNHVYWDDIEVFTDTGTGSAAGCLANGNCTATVTTIAPVANFTCTPLSVQAPGATTCTDSSTNTPTSWAWTCGNATTCSTQNCTCTYFNGGLYSVGLTATNSAGNNTLTRTNYITTRVRKPVNVRNR